MLTLPSGDCITSALCTSQTETIIGITDTTLCECAATHPNWVTATSSCEVEAPCRAAD